MFKRALKFIQITGLILTIALIQSNFALATATLKDSYNTGDDSAYGVYDTTWVAQTFTASSNYNITSVKLKLWHVNGGGAVGTVTVSIRATSAGSPTGSDLTSGTIDGSTIGTASPGAWFEAALTSYALTSGTKYAIVIRAPTCAFADRLAVQRDVSSPTYTDGSEWFSGDSGSTWVEDASTDLLFETWGDAAASSSCSPPTSGNWWVKASDNCYINTNVTIQGILYINADNGPGTFNVIDGAVIATQGVQSTSTLIYIESSSGANITGDTHP